jgi:hypothetical protein
MTPHLEPVSGDGAQASANQEPATGVSWMTTRRTSVIEKVAEVKKKLQESSMSGVGYACPIAAGVSPQLLTI